VKIAVWIHRQGRHETQWGTLRAWILQDGRRGVNLLAEHKPTDLENAKRQIRHALEQKLGSVEIEWMGEGAESPVTKEAHE